MSSIIRTNGSQSNVEMFRFERYSECDGYGYSPLTGDSYDMNFYSENSIGEQALFTQIRLITESLAYGEESGHLKLSTVKDGMTNGFLFIHADAKVGINIEDPTEALDVLGNIAVSGTVDGVDIAELKDDFDTHKHSKLFTPNGANQRLTVASNDFVGVGTTEPTNIVEIDLSTSTGSTAGKGLLISRSNDANDGKMSIGSSSPDNDDYLPSILAVGTRSHGLVIEGQPESDSSSNRDCIILRGVDPDDGNSATESSPVVHIQNYSTTLAKFGTSSYALDVSGQVHASSFPTSSDLQFKENIVPISNVLEKINQLEPICFSWNKKYAALGRASEGREVGLIAQQVEGIFPELVTFWKDKKVDDSGAFLDKNDTIMELEAINAEIYDKKTGKLAEYAEETYRGLEYGRLSVIAIQGIKELAQENDLLRQELASLRKEVEQLKQK